MLPALLLLAALCAPAVSVQSQRTCVVHEKCVPLPECQALLRLVAKNSAPTNEEKAVLRAAQCGWAPTSRNLPLVCCDLVPRAQCAVGYSGYESVAGLALAGEFPWMARLAYRRNGAGDGAEVLDYGGCAATLINDRYLLTAAHCVAGREPPAYVRLGELDAETDPDCAADGTACAPTAFNVAVETVVVHPEYAADGTGREHDIALVRMARAVKFSSQVSSVCLPVVNPAGNATLEKDEPLTVLGWGSLSGGNATRHLMKSVLREVPHEFCTEKYRDTPHHVDGVHQLCGRGFAEGADACHGDPGAPLMVARVVDGKAYTVLEGIASFGTRADCGPGGMPAVFSRVSTYLPWIVTNIKLA